MYDIQSRYFYLAFIYDYYTKYLVYFYYLETSLDKFLFYREPKGKCWVMLKKHNEKSIHGYLLQVGENKTNSRVCLTFN